jgi:hypothetical protein
MGEIVDARRKMAARVAEYDADVADKQRSCMKNGKVAPERQRDYDYAPCIAARWNGQLDEHMLTGCRAFLSRHERDADPDARENVAAARFFIVLALDAAGDFETARPLAEPLTHDPGWQSEVKKLMSEWPVD